MVQAIFRGLRRWAVRLLVLALLAGGAYGAWIHLQLNRTLDAAGVRSRSVRYRFPAARESGVPTPLPFAVRASVKRLDAQNWLPEGEGLIDRRLAWSPTAWRWLDDPPPPLGTMELLELKAVSLLPIPFLLEELDSPEARRREVAGQELRLRTGEDLGYRPDLPPRERAAAIAAWKRWWEENKIEYGAKKLKQVFEEK